MKKNLINLIKVKTIVTFIILAVFVVQALRGELDDKVVTLATTVIAFYFGTQRIDEDSKK